MDTRISEGTVVPCEFNQTEDSITVLRPEPISISDVQSTVDRDNHDSCYDSDESAATSHDDVSRQSSDTLAAEHEPDTPQKLPLTSTTMVESVQRDFSAAQRFTDSDGHHPEDIPTSGRYVTSCSDELPENILTYQTTQQHYVQHQLLKGSHGETGSKELYMHREMSIENVDSPDEDAADITGEEDVTTWCDYSNKLDFALKLGYQEAQLRAVLLEQGPHVTQNVLLRELIGLDKNRQRGSDGCDDDALDNNNTGYEEEHLKLDMDEKAFRTHSPTPADDITVEDDPESNRRYIVIDGSNVAMSHGNKQVFSCQGIKLAVDWFKQRGHTHIMAFVPLWRKETPKQDTPITDQDVLLELEREKLLAFTPSRRRPDGTRMVCYDDRYILKMAARTDGIVVSNDNYRDLIKESAQYKYVIDQRLLMFTFVNDCFMPPDDPLGRHGPSLDNFLCKTPIGPNPAPPVCPYGKKCTYGNKCKYSHPERKNHPIRSLTDRMAEQTIRRRLEAIDRVGGTSRETSPVPHGKRSVGKSLSSEFVSEHKSALIRKNSGKGSPKKGLTRTKSLAPGLGNGGKPALGRKTSTPVSSLSGLGALAAPTPAPCADEVLATSLTSGGGCKVTLTTAPSLTLSTQSVNSNEQRMSTSSLDANLTADTDSNITIGSLGLSELNISVERLAASPTWKHDTLRFTHSDPNGSESGKPNASRDVSKQLLSGHVDLARKLSDEASDDGSWSKQTMPTSKSTPQLFQKEMDVREPAKQPPVRKHKNLSRQFSLKGSEDPRWQQQQQQQRLNKLSVRFHGPQGPVHQGMAVGYGRDRKSPLQGAHSVPLSQMYSHIPEDQNIYGQETSSTDVPHQGISPDHTPAGRMASAPPEGYNTYERSMLSAQRWPHGVSPGHQEASLSPQMQRYTMTHNEHVMHQQMMQQQAQASYYQNIPPPMSNYQRPQIPYQQQRHLAEQLPFTTYSKPDHPNSNMSLGSEIPINNLHPGYSSMSNLTGGVSTDTQPASLFSYGSQGKIAATSNIETSSSDVSDQRISMYNKLSELFGSDIVLSVMSKYPLESDPKVLARYIARELESGK